MIILDVLEVKMDLTPKEMIESIKKSEELIKSVPKFKFETEIKEPFDFIGEDPTQEMTRQIVEEYRKNGWL